jgi:site-specific recombinase XerD
MITEAKFYLEKRKNKETGNLITTNVPIFLFYSFEGKRLQYFTGYRIDAILWDEKQMKVKKGFDNSADINRELGKLKTRVEEIHDKAKALNENLTIEEFRERIKGDKPVKVKKNFSQYLEEYLESSKLTKGAGTMRAINSSFNIFNEFAKEKNIRLDFKNITQEFYDLFLNYCFNDKDYKNAYTGKLIKDLKSFLNWATERGHNSHLDFRKKSFKKLTEEPEIIYLTYDELMKLYNHNFKSNPSWEQIRDVFCFGCFTGMRFSDIASLAPEHIQSDFINFRVVKTSQNNTIPLNPYSKKILAKYKGKFLNKCLPVISEANTNEYLKDLFGSIGLNRKVQKINFQGAKRIELTAPLCEVITFHISKKTFMTNFLAKGGSLITAMSITGNKDFKTAKRYFKVVDSLKADEMTKVFGKVSRKKNNK